jgi:hypothetical protein
MNYYRTTSIDRGSNINCSSDTLISAPSSKIIRIDFAKAREEAEKREQERRITNYAEIAHLADHLF